MSARWPPPAGTSPVETRTGGAGVASGKPPKSSVLAGREHELARIDALLGEAAAGRSGALLVVGEPGVGKTTLLEVARARADSFTCLIPAASRPRPIWPTPGCLACSTRSGTGWLTSRTTRRRRSGRRWPGRGGATTADPFLLGAATLSLLAAAAEHRPVLVLVDDVQWLDPESAAAITFAARRLGPDAVAFLLAAREGTAPAELSQGLPVLPVAGLSPSAAAMLLPPGAAPGVVERLVAATQGNPLALVEVAARLDDAQWLGAAELPDPLPSGDRWREHFRTTLAELSAAARTAVLYLALVGDAGSAAPAVIDGAGRCRHQRR